MLYLDSSALIKQYQEEDGSQEIRAKVKQETDAGASIFTSVLAYAEIHAAVARRCRDGHLSSPEAEKIHDQFDEDWVSVVSRLEVSKGVLGFVRSIVKTSPLRGADAIHLASTLWLRDNLRVATKSRAYSGPIVFVAADKQLLTAAAHHKVHVFNPEKA